MKGGRLVRRFQREDAVYRYAVDYDSDLRDHNRYYESFREQGWTLVNNTWTGWHYFRKKYDPALPEPEYQIYTDPQSRQEMLERWASRGRNFLIYALIIIAIRILSDILLKLSYPDTYQSFPLRDIVFYSVCLASALTWWLCSLRVLKSGQKATKEKEEENHEG